MTMGANTEKSWGGIEGLIKGSMQSPTAFAKAIAKPAIIAWGENLFRFIVWDDAHFLGFVVSRNDAIELAHKEKSGTSVYVCDTQGSVDDPRDNFVVVAGTEGAVGTLPSQIREQGLMFAKEVLADNIIQKRDIMIQAHGQIRAKHKGLPPLDSPPHPDREEWERVQTDFDNAKIWRDRFDQRHP